MATYPPRGFKINALLGDTATESGGKIYLHGGGWNLLTTARFPFVQPRISIGGVISVPYTETNKNHTLELHLENEDGARMPLGPTVTAPDGAAQGAPQRITAQFTLGRPPQLHSGDAQPIPIAMNFDRLRFDSPGAYSFVLSINGEEIERLTFRVTSPPGVVFATSGSSEADNE